MAQIGRSHQSPLVGRQQELDRLNRLIAVTEHAAKFRLAAQKRLGALPDVDRNPQAVLLLGDVGIGKTRLAEELGREVKRHNWVVAWSRVYAQEGAIPYRLWTEVLRKVMQQGVLQSEAMRKRPLAFSPLSALLPEEFQLPSVEFPTSLSPEQEQLRLWEAVRELLVLVSETSPILIVLDDLQWADSSSCELLAYLARRAQGYPLAIVGTCRENELGADHPLRGLLAGLRRENAVETIALEPLSAEQIASLVNQVAHTTQPLVQRISDRAAGNPFFAEELARTVAESPGGSGGDEAQQLPDTIAAVLTLRLGRLSSACQRLLSKASVLGSSFAFQVISAMEANSPNYDEDTVLELLEEALASGMLTEEGVGTRITYHFWHPLLASHMQEQLSAARRASQHRRAAEVLQKIYAGREEWYAAITDHLVQGGADPEQIAQAAELAGNYSYGLSSYPEAEKHFRIALAHLDENKENWQHRANILEYLGECTRIQGKYGEAQVFYERCLAVRVQNYKQDSSVDLIYELQLQAVLWREVSQTLYDRGSMAQTIQAVEEGMKILRNANITTGSAWATLKLQQGYVYWREGNYDFARKTANEALVLFTDRTKQPQYDYEDIPRTYIRLTLSNNPVDLGRIYILLSNIEAANGRCSDALPYLEKALAIFEQYDYTREIAIACCNLGDLYLRTAEYVRAQSTLRRCLSIAERMGDMALASFALGNLGLLDVRIGSLKEAEIEIRESISHSERIEDPLALYILYVCLANALQEQGKLTDVKSALLQSLKIGHVVRIPAYTGFALVGLGHLRLLESLSNDIKNDQKAFNRYRNLRRAKNTLFNATVLSGIEAETRVEGRLVLSQVFLQLADVESAREQVELALKEAKQAELVWLTAYGERVAGSVLSASNRFEEAYERFEKALRIANTIGMRLEEARAKHQYGALLLRQAKSYEQERRGVAYLEQARETFADCKAELDLQLVQRDLAQLVLK